MRLLVYVKILSKWLQDVRHFYSCFVYVFFVNLAYNFLSDNFFFMEQVVFFFKLFSQWK